MNIKLKFILKFFILLTFSLILPSVVTANSLCDREDTECIPADTHDWGTDLNSSRGYNSKEELLQALNGQSEANFQACKAATQSYSCRSTTFILNLGNVFGPGHTLTENLGYVLDDDVFDESYNHITGRLDIIQRPEVDGGKIITGLIDCPTDYYAISDNTGLYQCLRFLDFYLVPTVQESYSVNSVCGVGNPCNPSTGNKSQKEIDYFSLGSNNLNLTRYYNSQTENLSNHTIAAGWNHNYSGSLNHAPQLLELSTNASSAYGLPSIACLNGFNEIKAKVWGGTLIAAEAEYSNGACNIKSTSGATYATFTLERVTRGQPLPSITLPAVDYPVISEPDGSFYVFKQTANGWKNEHNPTLKLEQNGSNWVFTDESNVRETFNQNGQLIYITQVNGRTTELEYTLSSLLGGDDDPSTLDTVTDENGRQLVFNYNDISGVNRLTSVTTPDNNIQYIYSGNNLVMVTYPDNSQKTYIYGDARFPNHLTAINDENDNRFASWTYHADGKAASSEHAVGQEKVTLTYNSDYSTRVNGALNDTRTYHFTVERGARRVKEITGDECRTCGNGFMQSRTYDTNGFLNGYTDWQGNQTTIINNSRGLPIQQTDAVGTPEERTTTTTWHSSLNLPLTITEPKRQSTFTYSTTGQLLTKTVTDPATSESRTTTYTYHPLGSNGGGLIATIDGPRSDVNDITSYAYNASDDLISITNALGHVTQITSHDASGRPLTIIDANGTDITLSWDLRGRLTQSTFDGRATDYTYDPVGQLTRVTQADDSYLEYSYDDAHRLTGISDNLGNKIKYVLDKMGNRTSTNTTDVNGTIASSQTAIFDKLSRLQQSLGSNGQQQTVTYDDNHNPLTSTDALTRQTQSNYDALDRLIKSIDPDTKETNFEYDTQDNLTKVTDARGLETTYVYNGFDEVVSQTSPDTGTTTYTYDSAGNVTSMTDARGIMVNYTYDALNRVLTESYPDSTELVRYRYDNGTRRNGRIYDMRDSGGRTIFSYDTRGNNTYRRHDVDGYRFITRYSYWNDNRLRVVTYPSGRQVLYTRDAAGRINRVRTRPKAGDPWEYLANNISYEPFGDINGMTLGNGLTYSADFDLDARLTQQTINSVLDSNYSYDTVDNLITLNDALDTTLNQTFTYDNIDRLDTEAGQYGTRDFDYDEVGNRTRQEKDTGSVINSYYQATANRLQTLNSQTPYVYDAVGNTLTDRNGRRTLTYNDAGRLETVAYDGIHRATYSYNAQGQRVKKARTLTDGRTLNYYFQYDKQGQLLSEVYYIDTRLVSYTDVVWLAGRPIAQIRTLYKSNGDLNRVETRYLHTDHLNTPRKATDENGTIVWRWDSDGFGHVQPDRDPDGDGKKQYVRLRFAGQYHDAETGLFYNYFRYYDPYTGRYVTSDPIGLAGGVNTYGYVGGNPIYWVDRYGLNPANPSMTFPGTFPNSGAYPGKPAIPFPSGAFNALSKALGPASLLVLTQPIDGGDWPLPGIMNNESEDPNSEGESCPVDKKGDRTKGDRFKDGDDAQSQFEEIEKAQRDYRRGKGKKKIDNIDKSKQRADHAIKPWNIDY